MTRILVAVIYLVSLVTASSAQVVGAASTRPATKSGQTTASSKKANATQGTDTDLQETLHAQLQTAVQQAEEQQDDTYWVNKGAAIVQKECAVRGMNCALEVLFEAEQAAHNNPLKAVVCLKDGSECVPALAYGQGAVQYATKNLLYYKGQIIVETSPQFVELVTHYGLHSEEDRQAAKKYFFALMQRAYKDCDKVSANEDTSHWNTRRTNYCAEEISSMAALAMIAKDDREKKQIASAVYSLMKSEYDSVGGGIIMTGGTVALGVLGTQDAYNKLEQFLTDDTLPSTAGNVWEGINSPIKSTAQNSYKALNKDGRYLNRINEKFLYLDKQEAKRQGFSNTAWQSSAIQYPYANTLEDMGTLLGQQSAENGAAKRLATKIVERANQYAKNGKQMAADIHYPLVVGIIDGWRQINNSMNVPSKELITLLYKGNWFDINEGTQRRVHRKAYEFGLRRNMVFDPPAKDPQKIKDYIAYSNVETITSAADVVVQFVLLDMMITKLPALAKGIPNAVRVLKQRSAWVGTHNFIRKLPRTPSMAKAKAGAKTVAKPPVKPAVTPKPTVSAKPQAPRQPAKARPTGQQAGQTTSVPAPRQPAAQPVATQTAPVAENVGATTQPIGPLPEAAPITEAVSPAKLQEQVTGPLAERVKEGNSALQNIKSGVRYVGGVVQDYFKALVRPSNTLMMSVPGIPAPGTWAAVRAERKAAEASKAIELAQQEVERTTQIYKQVLRARPSVNEGAQAEVIWRAEEETAYMNMAKASENLGRVEEEAARTKQLTQVRQAEQAATSAPKAAAAQQEVVTTGVRAEESTLSVTPENYLSAKRVGTNYEVKALDAQGQVFSHEMTAAQYRDLQKAARSTGKKESLELRGQRLELQHRRAMRASAQTEVGQAASTQLYQATEKATREIAAQVDEVKRLSSSADRLVSGAKGLYSTITKAGADSSAEALYAQLTAQGKEIDRLYVEINDIQRAVKANKVSSAAEAAEKSAQVAQKTKQIQTLVKEMENASAQLRLLEVNAEVKALGQLRVSAQQKLAEIRSLLQTANTAKIPSAETAQLRKALQQVENVLYSTQGVGREALTLGKEGSFANAVDKAGFAQRKIENALQNVESYAKSFQQSWGTELKQSSKLTTQKAAQERVAAAQARQAEQARKAEAARRSAEAQKTAELAKQAQTVATPKLSEGAQYLINDGHQLVGQINALEENIYTYGWIWKQDPKLLQSFDELKQSISILQNMRAGSANATVIEQQLATVRGQLEGVWNTLGHKISVVENSAGRLPTADYAILDEVKSVQDLCGKLLSAM